jgi:hypothetical protein
LRLWHTDGRADGEPLRGHQGVVIGALPLADGRILSWSYDGRCAFGTWMGNRIACCCAVVSTWGYPGRLHLMMVVSCRGATNCAYGTWMDDRVAKRCTVTRGT